MRRLVPAALLALAVTGCVTAPEDDPVLIKLNELDERIARIERVVANQSLLEMAQRVDSIQTDVRTLRGRIEELENSNEALRKQQRDLYADLDQRIAALGSGGAPGIGGAGGAAAAAGEQAAYDAAFNALKAGDYPGAIAAFREFLSAYPAGALAPNAQYWLGEAYYVTRDFGHAEGAFRAVAEQWPDSDRAPDALLRLGYTQQEMQQSDRARATLTELTQRYPDSEAARLAAERLRQLR